MILLFRYLPQALKERNPEIIADFEAKYENLGIPALVLQVITGLIMGLYIYPFSLFKFRSEQEIIFNIKLLLLLTTLGLAIHVRLFIIPKLSPENLNQLAYHVAAVTAIAVAFVYFGISFRYGL